MEHDYKAVAQKLLIEADKLNGEPGMNGFQVQLLAASGSFAIAAAIQQLAKSNQPQEQWRTVEDGK